MDSLSICAVDCVAESHHFEAPVINEYIVYRDIKVKAHTAIPSAFATTRRTGTIRASGSMAKKETFTKYLIEWAA